MLDIERARWALEETARREGVSYETVIKNIEDAISDAIARCKRSGDELALAMWRQIPCVGDAPDPLELVAYLGEKIYGQQTPPCQLEHKNDLPQ